MLPPLEQDLIFKYLLASCHSFARLQAQNYTLPTAMADNEAYPRKTAIKRSFFRETPKSSPELQHQQRRAIVVDCEMVQVVGGRRELALLSAVDFLTGEVLINKYVQPTAEVTNWGSEISGVTPAVMAAAVAKGQALLGWQSARQALWEYADLQTILIGHSLNFDLDVLGIFHSSVVDSAILTGEAVFITTSPSRPLKRLWSLKTLSREFLNYEI
jgi:hypothetical protein